ncbi:hypothetical protein SAMD00019534_109530 [Acytostelium subglobosum LB1]|uniref:hypothetical protein n=1 Tax=Acytostelium subglobosum LB1 TaxID=1410327 RepID=UPI000644BC8A|nr:hypothetical protein SAMD00019534_109530 [Acytostelium subglobosum LB1]GAM27777.1 hypothetical protein SAMD00019534_109530 [Acytostelium subglobosum LB1]|eukprot:XP_012749436.1 hypothetical protein SAMD00019534_109530 [Acytostelium subglobosum LB1]
MSSTSGRKNIFEDDDDDDDNGRDNKQQQQQRIPNNQSSSQQQQQSHVTYPIVMPTFKPRGSNFMTPRRPPKQPDAIVLTKEEIDYIVEHDVPKPKEIRNILLEDDEDEDINSNSTLNLNNMNSTDAADKKTSEAFDEVAGMKFESLLKMIFKNKRTGELDLDQEDIEELERMITQQSAGGGLYTVDPNMQAHQQQHQQRRQQQHLQNSSNSTDTDKR